MSHLQNTLLSHLRSLADKQASAALPDHQLLEAFRSQHSETAFAALLRRHGPMVWSVCRRVLGNHHDAEDAFQAVFLVFVRKAASIRKQESVSSFLHGIAYHIADKLKRTEVRRAARERTQARPPFDDPCDDITWRELRSVLDEELTKLPEQHRAPLVLCYLEGKTQDEAARLLGWSKNTFRRRLERGRDVLGRRLTRRGVTLSAALSAPLLADASVQAALPPLLASNTIRAGLAAARDQATGTLISAQVAALVEGGVASLLTKKTSMILALLVSLALGAGGLLAHRAVPSRTLAEEPATPKAAPALPPPARSANKDHALEIKGRVLDPDEQPVAGARLFLLADATRKKAGAIVRTRTDKEGRFHFTAKPTDFDSNGKTTLAVTANGFGPDWVEVTTINKNAITLRLVKDDVPIRGRILDLEGKPVPNAKVRVLDLYQTDLHEWLKEQKRGQIHHQKWIEPAALNLTTQALTEADGRFQLHGLGRERLAYLLIEGDTIERVYCWALTRDDKSLDLPKNSPKPGERIYPAAFDHIAAPTKPITGMVRDKRTGKPLPGFIVMTERSQTGRWIEKATTDEQGRYRIVGTPKQREYTVLAEGRPYFAVTKHNIADTPGLEPLVVNFELERGIEITGRILNKTTGEPIEAEVTYRALADNPHLKKVTGLDQGFRSDGRNRSKADGSFFAIGLPGPGYLTVLAYEDDYHKPQPPADWEKATPYLNTVPQLVHAWVRINPSEDDPKSMHCDIALEPAKPILGQVLDPDGKPLGGFFVAGLTGSPLILSNQLNLHEKSTFQVHSFDPGRPRILLFIHPQKKLGKVVVLRQNPREPLQVRLEPLGAVAGRVLDAEGRPQGDLQVRVEISRQDDNLLPTLMLFEHGREFYHLDPADKTDAGGKFRLDGLMPGLKYTLLIGEGERKSITRIVIRRENTTVESGKTKDLGDLKSKQAPEK